MTIVECPREPEVVDAVASGRWPDRLAEDLGDHLRHCVVCADVAQAAAVFGVERDAAWPEAHVPSAAHVWWRAQMRARRDAARAAARPITLVQGLAAACGAGVAAGSIGFVWSSLGLISRPDLANWSAVVNQLAAAAGSLAATASSLAHLDLALAAGAVLLLMPAALYFALTAE